MIELIATAESVTQGKTLLDVGIDVLYFGEEKFGLRLPNNFSSDEMKELTNYAHENGKKVYVAVNGLMHNDRIKEVVPYLEFLEEIKVDAITVGDPGVIHLIRKNDINLSYIYDGHTLVTSANQINFWAKRGAAGVVLARELTKVELEELASQIKIPAEILVYGATCIHHSKRPLVTNYFNFVGSDESTGRERGLFISEPRDEETHYSIYEDEHGTHIFANNDINLMMELENLVDMGLTTWKLDGIYTPGENFVSIAKLFVEAKRAIEAKECSKELLEKLNERLIQLHPPERGLDEGFYVKDPDEVQ